MHSFIFLLCAHRAPETLVPLLRLPTLNKTIWPAKQAACDLCGLHGSAMQRLRLEIWSALVLRNTWRCGGNAHVQIYRSICVYLCLHLYYCIWNDIYLDTFQLLAALLTMYAYGYTHNSIYVHMSTHLYTYISTMHMPVYTYLHIYTLYFIFTHHIVSLKWPAFWIRTILIVDSSPPPPSIIVISDFFLTYSLDANWNFVWRAVIVGALVTWAIYTQGQLLLWSSLIITGVVPGYKWPRWLRLHLS